MLIGVRKPAVVRARRLMLTEAELLMQTVADLLEVPVTSLPGMAVSFRDMSAVVRDFDTPANNYRGPADGLLRNVSPPTTWVRRPGRALWVAGTSLRSEFDASGNALGLRLEPSRTNVLLHATDFSNEEAWGTATNENREVTPADSIFAGEVAYRHVALEPASSSDHRAQDVTLSTSTAYALSCIVEQQNATSVAIRLSSDVLGGALAHVDYNFTTGAVTSGGMTLATGTARVEDLGTGPNGGKLVRLSAVCTTDDEETDYQFIIYYRGTTDDELSNVIHHAQLEAGEFVTSPILTADSAVTRAGVNVQVPKRAWPGGLDALTCYARAAAYANVDNSRLLAPISDPAGQRSFLNIASESQYVQTDDGSAGDTVAKAAAPFWDSGDFIHYAMTLDGAADVAVTKAGQTPATGSQDNWDFTLGGLQVGANDDGTSSWVGHIAEFMVLPQVLAGAHLQALTQD